MGWVARGLISSVMAFSVVAMARGELKKDYVEGYFRASSGNVLYWREYDGKAGEAIMAYNGLTQDTDHWDTVASVARKTGKKILLFDSFNQGRSLERYIDEENVWGQIATRPIVKPLLGEKMFYGDAAPLIPPAPVKVNIEDAEELRRFRRIKSVTPVGLSYGGFEALLYAVQFPKAVDQLIMLAPYEGPMPEQDQLIKYFMEVYRRLFPLVNFDDDELYDWILRGLVLATYHLSEPETVKWGLLQPYAVSQSASDVRHYNADDLVARLKVPTVLVMSGKDQYIKKKQLVRLFSLIPKDYQAALIEIHGVEHKSNESVGPHVGGLIYLLDQGYRKLKEGRSWVSYPGRGTLESVDGKDRYDLPKASVCETFLRPIFPASPNLPLDRIKRNNAEVFVHSWRAQLPSELRKSWDTLVKMWWGK